MDKSRNYILERLKSRRITIDEFNYNKLMAPPLCMFLNPFDIAEIRSIATSLKYSAQPEVRYKEIDRVCRRKGLVKFAAGTNRVVYRHPEFPEYLFKIAADDVGMKDNPAEFRNQMLLKPFVAKCYEISPCGTVAIVEKVNPITSREEFISIADDAFELLFEFIIGKYIVADCGTKHFMNFGVRKGFGVVLLDYPYLYELDGDKLFCSKDDLSSPSGKCDGVIDYDLGYNFLQCTKCGAIYRAQELEKKIADNELIIRKEGEIKMKATIRGGRNNENRTVDTSAVYESPLFNKVVNKVTATTSKTKKVMVKKEEVEVKPVEEKKETREIKKSVNGVSTEVKKEVRSPFTISEQVKEEVKKEAIYEDVANKVSPVKIIEESINSILENIDKVTIDTVKIDLLNRSFDTIIKMLGDNLNVYELLSKHLLRLFDDLEAEDFVEACKNDQLAELIQRLINNDIEITSKNDDGRGNIELKYVIKSSVIGNDFVDDNDIEMVELFRSKEQTLTLKNLYDPGEYSEVETPDPEPKETEEEDDSYYNGLCYYEAFSMKSTDIIPDEEERDVIIVKDADGNYVRNSEKFIIGIDMIDNQSVSEVEVVSKDWLHETVKALDKYQDAEEEAESEVEVVEEDDVIETSEIPVGALGAQSMEQFVESAESEE